MTDPVNPQMKSTAIFKMKLFHNIGFSWEERLKLHLM